MQLENKVTTYQKTKNSVKIKTHNQNCCKVQIQEAQSIKYFILIVKQI